MIVRFDRLLSASKISVVVSIEFDTTQTLHSYLEGGV